MQGARVDSFTVGDDWQVEPSLNLISRSGAAVKLSPRAMDLLVYMSARSGDVISIDDIVENIWDGIFGADGSIYNCVYELRQALGDDPNEPKYIETISKRGYRLIASVVFADRTDAARNSGSRSDSRVGRRTRMLASLLAVTLAALIFLLVQTGEPPAIPESRVPAGSIAVLPFKDLSPDGDKQYFADGITEELLNTLAGVKGLQVAARTSSFYFRDRDPSVAEVRQTLGVAHILEGSVRLSGNRVRITAQLIDAHSGFHLWSESYDRELVDIFAIQDEISTAIVDALRTRIDLGQGIIGDSKPARVVDPEAYTEYLIGRHLLNQRTREASEQAIEHFKRAIAIDNSHAPSEANLAISYGLHSSYGGLPIEEAYELGKSHADRAIELDPELAEAHGAQYFMEILQDTHDPEFKHLNRAIALNPSYMDARNWKVNELLIGRKHAESLALREASLKIDPLSIIHNINYARGSLRRGRRKDAVRAADRLKLVDFGWSHRVAGNIVFDRGNLAGAIEIYLTGLKSTPRHGPLRFRFGTVLSYLGFGEAGNVLFPHPRWPHFNARMEGDWEAALKRAKEGLEGGEDDVYFLPALAEALYFNRDLAGARAIYDRMLASPKDYYYPVHNPNMDGQITYALALRVAGNEQEAEAAFAKPLGQVQSQEDAGFADGDFYQFKGLTLMYLGRFDEALDALERAFEAGNRDNGQFAGSLFDPTRDSPRFLALQQKYASARRENRALALTLVCADNLPDMGWRPSPETCAGQAAVE